MKKILFASLTAIAFSLSLTTMTNSSLSKDREVTINTYLILSTVSVLDTKTHRIEARLSKVEADRSFSEVSSTILAYNGFPESAYYPIPFDIDADILESGSNVFQLEVRLVKDGKSIVYSGTKTGLKNLESLDTIEIILGPPVIDKRNRLEDKRNAPKASVIDFSADFNVIQPDRRNNLPYPVYGDKFQPTVKFEHHNTESVFITADFQRCNLSVPGSIERQVLLDSVDNCAPVKCTYNYGTPDDDGLIPLDKNGNWTRPVSLSTNGSVKTPNKNGVTSSTLMGIQKQCWCTLMEQTMHRRNREVCAKIQIKNGSDLLDSIYYCFAKEKCNSFGPEPEDMRTRIHYSN